MPRFWDPMPRFSVPLPRFWDPPAQTSGCVNLENQESGGTHVYLVKYRTCGLYIILPALRRTQVATDNRIHQQMEIEDNEARHQNAMTYNQQNALPYTG